MLEQSNNLKKLKNLKYIDLFAGIGGFRLALDSFGAKCVFTSEWDKYAQKLVDDFYKARNKKFRLKIHNYEYDGTLLERINDNFKLEVFYDFSTESHSLIKSKFITLLPRINT
mgnify:CR=1 FL=1